MPDIQPKTSSGPTKWEKLLSFVDPIVSWLATWWLLITLLFLFEAAWLSKYVYHNQLMLSMMIDATKAVGIIMLVVYVIYTRTLALETKKMAFASMGLFSSERGAVLTELEQASSDFERISDEAKDISRTVHVKDKRFSEEEFVESVRGKSTPCVLLRVKNMSGRRIEVTRTQYSVRHTGAEEFRPVSCNLGREGTLGPWADKEIVLAVAPEGDLEVDVTSIQYLDGDQVQSIQVQKTIRIQRIRRPVSG